MRHLIAILLGVLVVAGSAAEAAADKARTPLAVVVAKGSKITGLSRADLRRCFTGTPVTSGGSRLIPFNYAPGSAERTAFDRGVLGMSPDEAGRFWIDRKVRGQSSAPRTLPSAAYVVKVVAKFPGAISYVPADQVTADVKVIAIDGLRPGDAGYSPTLGGE